MNPIADLLNGFRDLFMQVPEFVQPLVVALAGTVPYIEGELSAALGIWGGLNPVVAGIAGASGNFLSVVLVVLLGSRIRRAITESRARRGVTVEPKPESKGRARFRRFVVRFGVPGASLIGPVALPTQFTATVLASSGVPKGWVLLWQGIAIVLWTTLVAVVAWGGVAVVTS